jgi:hypothetical protein
MSGFKLARYMSTSFELAQKDVLLRRRIGGASQWNNWGSTSRGRLYEFHVYGDEPSLPHQVHLQVVPSCTTYLRFRPSSEWHMVY